MRNGYQQGSRSVGSHQPFEGRFHHLDGAGRVHIAHIHIQGRKHFHRLFDRVGDVVEFEVQENLVPALLDFTDNVGTAGIIEFHSHFHIGFHPLETVQKRQGFLLTGKIARNDNVFHANHIFKLFKVSNLSVLITEGRASTMSRQA